MLAHMNQQSGEFNALQTRHAALLTHLPIRSSQLTTVATDRIGNDAFQPGTGTAIHMRQ